MEKKKDFIFVGNGRENPTGLIINIGIQLDKVDKKMIIKTLFSSSGTKHPMLYLSIHRKLDKKTGEHILDDYGNSHFVVMDINKIDYEKEKASNPDPL